MEKMKKAVEFINQKTNFKPETGIILGSGLGKLAGDIDGIKIPYSEIPGFKTSSVQGHAGNLIIGKLSGKDVIAMQGRLHYYEGNSLQDVVYPVRVMKLLGIKNLIVTNAAGGINRAFKPGDLMLIEDHINLTGNSPLIGPNLDEFGPRFPDMSEAYTKNLMNIAESSGKKLGIDLQKGIYVFVGGPTYEPPAEIRMLRTLGADAVGMSTVPEVVTARHAGVNVLGISCITNMAAGILDAPLAHSEVMETASRVEKDFAALVKEIVAAIQSAGKAF